MQETEALFENINAGNTDQIYAPGKEILETEKSGRLSSWARESVRRQTTSSNPEIVCPNEEAKMDFKFRWLK